MIMDIIGNVNIYFHNRKTGENLHYARVVHGTYRKFTAIMAVSFIPTALLGYICRRLVTRAAISASSRSMYPCDRSVSSCDRPQ